MQLYAEAGRQVCISDGHSRVAYVDEGEEVWGQCGEITNLEVGMLRGMNEMILNENGSIARHLA